VSDLLTEQWWWRMRAACQNADPDLFFPETLASAKAKKICKDCPVRQQCLAHAIEYGEEFGIWGGMTRLERQTAA
jgi:WhiB family redox-sensing transcriptional regulator